MQRPGEGGAPGGTLASVTVMLETTVGLPEEAEAGLWAGLGAGLWAGLEAEPT